jgi:hypothetical protein
MLFINKPFRRHAELVSASPTVIIILAEPQEMPKRVRHDVHGLKLIVKYCELKLFFKIYQSRINHKNQNNHKNHNSDKQQNIISSVPSLLWRGVGGEA